MNAAEREQLLWARIQALSDQDSKIILCVLCGVVKAQVARGELNMLEYFEEALKYIS